MNIAIYTWALTNGGAERVSTLWAKGFSQNNNVSLVLDSLIVPSKYPVEKSVKVLRQISFFNLLLKFIPDTPFLNKLLFRINETIWRRYTPDFIKKRLLARVLKKINPDVIIVVMPEFYERVKDALTFLNMKIPVIVTDHNVYERPSYAPYTEQKYREKFVNSREYDALTVLTNADRNVLKQKMDEEFMKKVFVLPNPLTYEPIVDVPKKEKIILAAGRLEIWHCKGFDILLKAWAQIYEKFPEWQLEIAGGGDPSFLLKLASDLGIEKHVRFLGFIDIKKQFEKSEIFVLSSRYEGFGMVLTEAMSQGCACVACDYKGRQREIIADDNQGVICPTDDVQSVADALYNIVSDDLFRHNIQKGAIERSKFYELPNIMKRWEEIFAKIVVNQYS